LPLPASYTPNKISFGEIVILAAVEVALLELNKLILVLEPKNNSVSDIFIPENPDYVLAPPEVLVTVPFTPNSIFLVAANTIPAGVISIAEVLFSDEAPVPPVGRLLENK